MPITNPIQNNIEEIIALHRARINSTPALLSLLYDLNLLPEQIATTAGANCLNLVCFAFTAGVESTKEKNNE